VTLTWEKLLTAGVSLRTLRHSAAALGENIYVYGGISGEVPTGDLMMFNTGQYCEDFTNPCPSQTLDGVIKVSVDQKLQPSLL